MALLIKFVFGVFWAISAGFIVFLAYIVLQTEHDPRLLWGWLVMCGFTFLSVTWLACNIIFFNYNRREPQHHGPH